MSHAFHSSERLKSGRSIGRLFGPEGQSAAAYPLRVVFRRDPGANGPHGIQVAFVVPKKRFKSAVDRNRLKRRMREAYRLNKDLASEAQEYCRQNGEAWHLLFMYAGKEDMAYATIEKKLRKLLQRVQHDLLPRPE